jgi:hypothetical protein
MKTTYTWQHAYRAAVLETDDSLLPGRILEARAAIEQRRLSPMDGLEQETLRIAQAGLKTLHAERCNGHFPNSNGNGH